MVGREVSEEGSQGLGRGFRRGRYSGWGRLWTQVRGGGSAGVSQESATGVENCMKRGGESVRESSPVRVGQDRVWGVISCDRTCVAGA